ncbi:WecB/TagA/CpsF family glycosyltransferase [Psychroserpens burtonensis]|uniref:WecB/TagA/CpsF family glycosyltransferase n=1 Tax=Psychroserpens burtonensis TaxID=49278 RepID=A0A5C7BAS3_9FLAO|nr:WecB/TagA/CpsF family glycosyltransferase [Psychroserpens burtonensis]TXE18857.1 WecB/TagA/CpsF family glycosyltransferase [Psychroserpens burtonensis]
MEAKSLNGVMTFAPTSRKELMQYAFDNHKIMVAVNAEKILHATDDSRSLINRNLGYPDGIGAVWALQKKGATKVVKIPGCELWLDVVSNYYTTKSFYLVGGQQEIIEATIDQLKSQFEGINICNYRNGYIKTEAEELTLIADIKKHSPEVVFIAMGSPKQEGLMERIQKSHQAVYLGLGGSFDVYTGHVKRAPKWWVTHNMEWTYRLLSQPSRIKRQIHLVRFFVNLHLNRY